MKISSVVLALLVWALASFVQCEIPVERYEEIHKICVEATGIEEAVIERARKGDFENSDTLKNYLACIVGEEKCLVNGRIDADATVDAIPPAYLSVMEPLVRDCVKHSETESELTEAAFKMVYCVYTKTLDKFFLP